MKIRKFDADTSARWSEIWIKTYRCPINEIFSALFIRRDAWFRAERLRTRNISPLSVHAWFHFTLITDNLWHRNSIWTECRWIESRYVNVSQCVVKVFAALNLHSLNISIDIWHRQHRNRKFLNSNEIKNAKDSFMMEISRASLVILFHFLLLRSRRRLLHFITTSFLSTNFKCNKTAQFIWDRKLSFLACCRRRCVGSIDISAQSCCGCKKFNYIIDARWRLWHYRKWKHDAWYHSAVMLCIQRESAGCAEQHVRHGRRWRSLQQQWTTRLSAAHSRIENERNEFEKCEREWEREMEKNMNKLKWTVMLIIPFSGYFATPVDGSFFLSPSHERRLKNIRNWNQISSSQIWFSGRNSNWPAGGESKSET